MARRFTSLGAVLALAVSFGFFASTAASASGPKGKATCTTVTGNASSTITISGCTGTANTGGASHPLSVAALASGGVITWVSGKTTTTGMPTTKASPGKKCPGYVKGAASNPTEYTFKGTVTADTSGMKVPGKLSGAVCVSTSGAITAAKAFKFS